MEGGEIPCGDRTVCTKYVWVGQDFDHMRLLTSWCLWVDADFLRAGHADHGLRTKTPIITVRMKDDLPGTNVAVSMIGINRSLWNANARRLIHILVGLSRARALTSCDSGCGGYSRWAR
jgi:hypothetical protein